MVRTRHQSLTAFAKEFKAPKKNVWKRAQELGINTSQGLTPTDQEHLICDMGLILPITDDTVDGGDIVPVHTAELVPTEAAAPWDLGGSITININVGTGNADHYNADASNTQASVQAALDAIFKADEEAGAQDAKEIEAVRSALKQKRLERIVKGQARVMGNDGNAA